MANDVQWPGESGPLDLEVLRELQGAVTAMANEFRSDATLDLLFLAYLRRMSSFGYFHYGPITIDVRLIEDLVDRTVARGVSPGPGLHKYSDDFVRFTSVLMTDVRRGGQRRVDELHLLLAFMTCGEGIPGRVFGELGVTRGSVEAFAREPRHIPDELDKLYSPEDVARYLGVHVQTVRGWIRSGRLQARRLAGQRALRIRESDIAQVLEPLAGESGDSP